MHPIILHDLTKAHTSDLHRQAETAALSLAARRAWHAPASSLDETHSAGSGGRGRPRRRSGGLASYLRQAAGGSGEVRGGQPALGSCARGSGTGRVVHRWLRRCAERRRSGGSPAAGAGGFRRQGLYSQGVRFAQPAGGQHRYPAQGKCRRLRRAHRDVESCCLRPCPHGRGPAAARHGTGCHGECRQRRQDVHDDCRPEVTGPAPPQHRQPDLSFFCPRTGSKGPGIDTITFRELLTHRAGFRLDSGRVFETDNAAREQVMQGIQQVDKRAADYNNINFTIFRDMLPFMEGVPDPGPAARAAAADRFFISYVQRQVFDPVGVTDATCAPVRDAMLMYPPPGPGTQGEGGPGRAIGVLRRRLVYDTGQPAPGTRWPHQRQQPAVRQATAADGRQLPRLGLLRHRPSRLPG